MPKAPRGAGRCLVLILILCKLAACQLSLWDSEYGCASFVNQTADIALEERRSLADKLMRLRPNRCLWGPPPPYSGKGRPKKHRAKFKLSDPATWGIPLESIEIDDPTWAKVEIQRWSQLHFLQAADHPMEVILVQRKRKKLSSKAASLEAKKANKSQLNPIFSEFPPSLSFLSLAESICPVYSGKSSRKC